MSPSCRPQAFNILRKSSNLILNLFMLMLDSGITDFVHHLERGVDAEQILLKVRARGGADFSVVVVGKNFCEPREFCGEAKETRDSVQKCSADFIGS